jgi:hypothetical protein
MIHEISSNYFADAKTGSGHTENAKRDKESVCIVLSQGETLMEWVHNLLGGVEGAVDTATGAATGAATAVVGTATAVTAPITNAAVRKRFFVSLSVTFGVKTITLPRQARDKRMLESSKQNIVWAGAADDLRGRRGGRRRQHSRADDQQHRRTNAPCCHAHRCEQTSAPVFDHHFCFEFRRSKI